MVCRCAAWLPSLQKGNQVIDHASTEAGAPNIAAGVVRVHLDGARRAARAAPGQRRDEPLEQGVVPRASHLHASQPAGCSGVCNRTSPAIGSTPSVPLAAASAQCRLTAVDVGIPAPPRRSSAAARGAPAARRWPAAAPGPPPARPPRPARGTRSAPTCAGRTA